jgi:short-subunit dehydrogenase
MNKKAVIIGATSGIGHALAIELHGRGYIVGLTGRRRERLEDLKKSLGERIFTAYMDVSEPEQSFIHLDNLIRQMGGMNVIILNAGVSNFRGSVSWAKEHQVIDVNVRGFAALASYSFEYFEQQGHGHLVGVSSVASLFGYGLSTAYNASKAFVNIYLQGYRQRANHSHADITVTNILPGFVKTEMTEGKTGLFWMVEAKPAVRQMANAIERKRSRAYVPKRWRFIAWLIKLIPDFVWDRI